MIAFHIDVDGFDPMIAAADTAPKARYLAWKSAQDAGYTSVTFARIRSSRRDMERFDEWAARQEKPCLVARAQAAWEAR